ncbi:PREDICTED: tyrosine aminotransferase [Eufriesea mexicana]|uniref:tyrosine aminotransferase n=1 Tax=Eufriesea mexicana TaxID=516756 RepID=UPI00083BD7C9|nr:PREDICTED: tyrosine aminotransferase [Eufriesea mexicana]
MSTPVFRHQWNVQASDIARRTRNPIRSIVESLVIEPNPAKSVISLSIGDPTTFGNLRPPKEVIEAVQQSLLSQSYNGYAPSTGYQIAKEAVAEYSSSEFVKVDAKDVILCSGCSSALDLCITALARRGQNILIPRPGFSIYRTLAEGLGINVKSYELRPEHGWEIDLDDLESQIDEFTAAIIINNPSNPCGSFSRDHTLDILDVAARYYIPIIADEIYEHMVFPGRTFHSLASLSRKVPILSCSGLTKRFLVPGWRMGWIIIHDRQNVLEEEIRKALHCLSQRIIGSNTLIQGALPAILKNTPQQFYDDIMATLYNHSKSAYNCVMKIPGLKPIMADGGMYMMVYIDLPCFPEFNSDLEFVQRLLMEESVFCLPGQCFDYPSYMRLVITVPMDMLEEACQRIQEFCERHHYKTAEDSQRNNLIKAGSSY